MKKGLLAILVIAAAFAAFSCGSSPEPAAADPTMPPWINDQPPEDMLWGVGVADNATPSMRMTMAETRGRQDISRQLSTLTQGMIIDYQREAGGIDNTAALQFAETITRQLSTATLTGAYRDVSWPTPDGKVLWTRIRMSKADALANINNQLGKAIDSEAARYAEFKAMDALKMMEQQLEKNPQSPEPVMQ